MIGTIAFVDTEGVEGTVETDLTLEYDGRHREAITSLLEEAAPGDRSPSDEIPSELLIALYEECPVRAIEIAEE